MIEEMKERLLEHKTVAAVLGTVLVMLVVFFAWSSVTRPQAQLQSDLPTISSSIPASSSLETTKTKTMASHSQDDSGKIFVDIKGAVKNEGVYELSNGSRVTDLVKKAGGFTDDADKKSVNLAEKLADEAVVYVAKIGEEVTPASTLSQAKPTTARGDKVTAQRKSILTPQLQKNSKLFLALGLNVRKISLIIVMLMVVSHLLVI